MRLRRHHRDDWSLPSGLAEVELFRFWEADLADTLPPDVLAIGPPSAAGHVLTPGPGPSAALPRPLPEPSPAPLWWAAGLVLIVLLLVLIV